MIRLPIVVMALLFAGFSPSHASSAQGGFSFVIEEKAPPEEISADVRAKIAPKAYQLSDANGLFFEIWLVPELALSGTGATAEESMAKIEPISVLGAIVVHQEDHHGFRDDPIDLGTYVLRMSIQPEDGDHVGTSPYDFFAILLPYDIDNELKEFPDDHEFMVELASEDTVAEHPAILALQPMDSAEGEFPRLDVNEKEEWHSLCLKFPAKAGGEAVTIPIKLVFEGIGDIE